MDALEESEAPLKLIASGSPLFGNHGYEGKKGACSGDDWEVSQYILRTIFWGSCSPLTSTFYLRSVLHCKEHWLL